MDALPVRLAAGDPAPMFFAETPSNPRYAFHVTAGRYVVLGFLSSARDATAVAMLETIGLMRPLFDDKRFCFFAVTRDPGDRENGRLGQQLPGIRTFWDFDGQISRAYGAVADDWTAERRQPAPPLWVVLDPTLRVLAVIPTRDDTAARALIMQLLLSLPQPELFAGRPLHAPVLYLPNVFEPDFCDELIALFDADGGQPSGFMRDVDGRTRLITDPGHKVRRDLVLTNEALIARTKALVQRRIVPEIRKVHQFVVTRMERHIIACYSAEDGGHFRPHRDNTTRGTAHRRFAVSINLNDGYDGGDLSFPEYGSERLRPPRGGAVVFSCSLLHAVDPVTRGRRYAFLPFLYDDAAAAIRLANNRDLDDSVRPYETARPPEAQRGGTGEEDARADLPPTA